MATSCMNFSHLGELDDWTELQDDLQSNRTPLRRRHRQPDIVYCPRLLLCHDFRGGYSENEDEKFQGYFPHKDGNVYWVRALALTDTFVYFSHKRVAIPPSNWTSACHKSGVRCLGTVILEHESSKCDARKLLRPNESDIGYYYADKLVRIAKHYGFDGYLLNMETTMGSPDEVKELLNFTEYLKYRLHKVVGPEARVIWYDSLTLDNTISYQNELNLATLPFFRVADGLFTNYFWKEKQVFDGAHLAGMLYRLNLWTGLDVWGRNVKYPAKWEIGKAIRSIQASGTSLALFAPAWVYEELGARDFEKNDFSFWYDYADESNNNISISEAVRPHPAPVLATKTQQMFYTSFNTGHGISFFVNGKPEYTQPWVNHGLQTALPTYPHTSHSRLLSAYTERLYARRITTAPPGSFKTSWRLDNSKAFYGGSSLKFTSDPYNLSPYYEAIFSSSPSSPVGSASSISLASSSPTRSVRRMPSSTQIRIPRVFVTPLFLLDFVMAPDTVFIFYVTFLKCAKGDVKVRLSGRWISGAISCYDEQDVKAAIYTDDVVYEADLSGSVLNSWVRKSFSFKVGQAPLLPADGENASPTFQINHLDIECSDNFSGSIFLGSLLLFSNRICHDSLDSTPTVKAPARVTSVSMSSYKGEKAVRWSDNDATSEWIIYIDGQMVGVASASGWILSEAQVTDKEELKVRVDAVGCGGTIVKGIEQLISVH